VRSLGIATKQPLNRNRLLESLQLLQLNPLIQNLSAELSAGRVLCKCAEVRVTEAKSDSIQVVLDNGRVPSMTPTQANELNFLGQR